MKPLRIIGAGGHGKVVADTAREIGFSDIAFLDDAWPIRTENGAWPVIGSPRAPDTGELFFCAIGHNETRSDFLQDIADDQLPVLRDPRASVSPFVTIGAGTLVVAGCVVNVDAEIGRSVILNTGCTIDHDCVIADYVHISPGAHIAGNAQVGEGTWVGIGAIIKEGITIGRNAMVAAGAVVIEDVPDNARVGGVPATPLRGA